ncbi:hypothetical protein KC19_2G265900 [Ceratodon purpureus]|uniref:Uncharacterized protein n=1 Tax=Ceratodon purpureus TaxID=3225 RepID=A0A8T0J0K8_CERPU|nr:hypothetical protein KC19_2G265900 [Ceratodon purpureus]
MVVCWLCGGCVCCGGCLCGLEVVECLGIHVCGVSGVGDGTVGGMGGLVVFLGGCGVCLLEFVACWLRMRGLCWKCVLGEGSLP